MVDYLQFFIKDTKSLNGTFINEVRLSVSREKSLPRELSTKDIVRFGLDPETNKG